MDATKNISDLLGKIHQNLQCSICLELLTNPVATKCDHSFCSFCITKFLNTKRQVPCPLCKMKVTKRSLQHRTELTVIIEGVKRLIAAFEEDTGQECTPSKTVKTSHTTESSSTSSLGASSSKKKGVRKASTSKSRCDKEEDSGMAANTTRSWTWQETSSDSSVSKRSRMSNFSVSDHSQEGVSGPKCKSRSRKALLKYLEEGNISHPDVLSSKSNSAESGESDKRKRFSCELSKSGNEIRSAVGCEVSDFDGEIEGLVEKRRNKNGGLVVPVTLERQDGHCNDVSTETHDSRGRSRTAARNRKKPVEEEFGAFFVPAEGENENKGNGGADCNNETVDGGENEISRKMETSDCNIEEKSSGSNENVDGTSGKNVSRRGMRSTSRTRKGRKMGSTLVDRINGEGEEANEQADCQPWIENLSASPKLIRQNVFDVLVSNDEDVDNKPRRTRNSKWCHGKEKRQDKNRNEPESKLDGRGEDVVIVCDKDGEDQGLLSPSSVASISSTQQLQNPIQPVSRTYSKKMKAAFKENDHNVQWALTHSSNQGLNSEGDKEGKGGGGLSMSAHREKTDLVSSGKSKHQTEEENEALEKHETKTECVLEQKLTTSLITCENEGRNEIVAASRPISRRKTIFKSKNLPPQVQQKSNVDASSSDLYDFKGGGTPPINGKGRGRKTGNGRKKNTKTPLPIHEIFVGKSGSCFKGKEQTRECHEMGSDGTSCQSAKRVHFVELQKDEKGNNCVTGSVDGLAGSGNDGKQGRGVVMGGNGTDREALVVEALGIDAEDEERSKDGNDTKEGKKGQEVFEKEGKTRHGSAREMDGDGKKMKRLRGDDKFPADVELLSKSTSSSNVPRRQRVRRSGVSVVKVQEKEREMEIERMRSKLHDVEDHEFMFSTQEAKQHIINANAQRGGRKSKEIESAFGFESSDEFDSKKREEVERESNSERRNVCTVDDNDGGGGVIIGDDNVNIMGGDEREAVKDGDLIESTGKKDGGRCHGNKGVEEDRDFKVVGVVVREMEDSNEKDGDNDDDKIVVVSDDDVVDQDLACQSHPPIRKADGAKDLNKVNDINEQEVCNATAMSKLDVTKCSPITHDAFVPDQRRRCTKQFARPDISVMTIFIPGNVMTSQQDIEMSTSKNESISQSVTKDDVENPGLTFNAGSQITRRGRRSVVESPSPKIIMETPLSSPPCMKSFTDKSGRKSACSRKASDGVTHQRESPISSGDLSGQDKTPGKREEVKECVVRCSVDGNQHKTGGRQTERLSLGGVKSVVGLIDREEGWKKGDSEDDDDNNEDDCVTTSAVIAEDTCVDEVADKELVNNTVCAMVIPDTEFPDADGSDDLTDDVDDNDGGIIQRARHNLVTQETQSPALFSADNKCKLKQVEGVSQVHNKDVECLDKGVEERIGSKLSDISEKEGKVVLRDGSQTLEKIQNVPFSGSLMNVDNETLESSDSPIGGTYTIEPKCTDSRTNDEESSVIEDEGKVNARSRDVDEEGGNDGQDNLCTDVKSHVAQSRTCDTNNMMTSQNVVPPPSLDCDPSQLVLSTKCQRSIHNECNQRKTMSLRTASPHHRPRRSPRTQISQDLRSQNDDISNSKLVVVSSDEDNRVAEESPLDQNGQLVSEDENRKRSAESQKMILSPKNSSPSHRSQSPENAVTVSTQAAGRRKRRSDAVSVIEGDEADRNKKSRRDGKLRDFRGSAPARLSSSNDQFFSDSDEEKDSVLIVRRSKRKCLSMDSVPLQPVVFGSDLGHREKDAAATSATRIPASCASKETTVVQDSADSNVDHNSTSNIPSSISSSSRIKINDDKMTNVQETAESTIPPSVQTQGELEESGSNKMSSCALLQSGDIDKDDTAIGTTLKRKTRRGFARKDNQFHKKALVSLPKSVLSDKVKAAILKEFTSQQGEKSSKGNCGGGGGGREDEVSDDGCQLVEDQAQSGEISHSGNKDGFTNGESYPSEKAIQQAQAGDKNDDVKGVGKGDEVVEEWKELGEERARSLHELSPTLNPEIAGGKSDDDSDDDVDIPAQPSPSSSVPSLPSPSPKSPKQNATPGDMEEAILIPSQSQGEMVQNSGQSDEDKRRLEQELFGQEQQLEEVDVSDSDSDLEDLHPSIRQSLSGRSASSLEASQEYTKQILSQSVGGNDEFINADDGDGHKDCDDDDDDGSLANESDDFVLPSKKRKRRRIASDSDDDNEDTENDRTNNSEMNYTSSSAFSSQSETISTQQREALEREVAELHLKISMCETALGGGSREAKTSTSSSNPSFPFKPTKDGMDVENTSPTKHEADSEQNSRVEDEADDDDVNENEEEMMSDNEDLFILPPSPSPPTKSSSRPPPVSSKPALSRSSGMASTQDFVKRFKSPGGSLHKRKPLLDFSRNSLTASETNTETVATIDDSAVSEVVISDSQDDGSEEDRGMDGNSGHLVDSGSPVIFSQGAKDRKSSSQTSRNVTASQSLSKKFYIIVASGLNAQEVRLVQKMTRTLSNVRLCNQVKADVTHIIMKSASKHDRVCDRTLKYFQGLARGLWTLSLEWVIESLQAGQLLPEEEYEIEGDTSGGTLGPKKARLSKEKLFDNYCFSCVGDSPELTKESMEELLTLCGASLERNSLDLALSVHENRMILRCSDSDMTAGEMAMYKSICGTAGVMAVKRDWVLDCISSYKILPPDVYLLTAGNV